MRTGLKVVLIIAAFLISVILMTIMKEATGGSSGSGGGIFGIIIVFALLAGIRAIWRYNPDSVEIKKADDDKYKLDKQ